MAVPLSLSSTPAPPARGWCGEFDGGPFVVVGSSIVLPSATAVQLLWCWKSSSSSSTSSAGESRHASKILRGSILKPANDSGKKTSIGRPFSRSASAFNVGWEASGVVPASFLDGDWPDLKLGVGFRKGLDCVCKFFSEVLSASIKDPCVILVSYGVPCNILYGHRLLLM
jgi:hypothetical protein